MAVAVFVAVGVSAGGAVGVIVIAGGTGLAMGATIVDIGSGPVGVLTTAGGSGERVSVGEMVSVGLGVIGPGTAAAAACL